tara:strand:- start:335 stop:874 length:540 start_codon:yes stop_codon:yes gene_type:complete
MSFTYVLQLQVLNKNVLDFYKNSIEKLQINKSHRDSGFDLYCPNNVVFSYNTTKLVDLEIRAAAYKVEGNINDFDCDNFKIISPVAFGLHCRSSIYKSNFRLANNIGIIDSGYRGNLKTAIDFSDHHLHNDDRNPSNEINTGDRYFQICMGDLSPFMVVLVDELDNTNRGDGGFGSTGR